MELKSGSGSTLEKTARIRFQPNCDLIALKYKSQFNPLNHRGGAVGPPVFFLLFTQKIFRQPIPENIQTKLRKIKIITYGVLGIKIG